MNAHPNLTFHTIISVNAPSPNHGHIRRYWREEFYTGLGGGMGGKIQPTTALMSMISHPHPTHPSRAN